MNYQNVPRLIGAALSHKVATLHELQTVYSIEDVYNLLEVVNVDAYNQDLIKARQTSSFRSGKDSA